MDRPRVVLYEDENRDGSAPTMVDDSTTPLDSIASPAVYYQDNYPREILHRGSKSAAGTPTRFLRQLNDNNSMVYPDDDDNRFIRFLKKPTTQIIVCVIIGTALGALLSHLEVSTDISNLVNLPGRVFLRVLRCFVIPMVFASLSTGIANIVLLGKVPTIGTRTAFYFVTFSFTAVLISLCVAMTLRHLNRQTEKLIMPKIDGWFHAHCDNGMYLEMTSAEELQCSALAMDNHTHFMIQDLDSVLPMSTTTTTTKISVSEQLAGILNSLFSNNIFTSFVDGVLLSVITFAIAFGAATTRASSRENSPLLDVLNQMSKIFFFVIARVINWSPLAVLSLVAGSLSSQENMSEALTHVGVLLLCNIVTAILLEFVFYLIVLWCFLRKSPFPYMRAMLPAVTFAFVSASSLATLPVTIRCVESVAVRRDHRLDSAYERQRTVLPERDRVPRDDVGSRHRPRLGAGVSDRVRVAVELHRRGTDPQLGPRHGILDLEHDLPERRGAHDVQLPRGHPLAHGPHEHGVQRRQRHVRRAHHRRAGRRGLRDRFPPGRVSQQQQRASMYMSYALHTYTHVAKQRGRVPLFPIMLLPFRPPRFRISYGQAEVDLN